MPGQDVAVDVALSLFAGLNTELSPTDLPEGLSPFNQDVAYLPGSVFSRPCLHKIFGTPFAGNTKTLYGKTYQQPTLDPLNLYLDSAGVLRKEDVGNRPGIYSTLANVVPGSYCNSVTASNSKEYFAFNDGIKGVDIPRQYDGTNFDRVSQDGPGAPPTVAEVIPPPLVLATSGAMASVSIATATGTDMYQVFHENEETDYWKTITYTSGSPTA